MKKFVLKLQPNSGQGKNIFFAKVIKYKNNTKQANNVLKRFHLTGNTTGFPPQR